MSVTIGMPSLKLNNVGRVGKHSGSFKKVTEEALAERRGRDADIDNSLAHENEIEGFKTAADLLEYSEKHIAELNADIDKKNEALSEINKERKAQGLKPVAKIKHIRKDTVAMVSTIFKPPFEFMETLSQEQQRRFLKDCREIFGGIVGEENIKSTAYHWDEICGHVHVFWEPMTKDGRLCAKDMHNIKFFNTVNRKVPQELRKRGWDIADCKIPDPNTKDIVLRIFESYVGGMSLAKIAQMLNAEGIPSPTAYKKNIYPNYKSVYTDDVWSSDGIRTMLKNEAYIGNTTLGRSYKVSYRSKKKATIPKKQWVRHEGTHEPLISKELWEMSRPRIERPARASSTTQEIPPLSGKLVCGCCGKYLVHRITGRKRKCDGEYVKYGYYRCPDVMKGKGTCENTRQISYLTLEKAVIEAINNAIKAYCDKDKLSIESMQAETIGFITKQYKQISDKIAKVQHRLDSIYTDKLDGLITSDEYVRYREQFNTELAGLSTKLSEAEEKLTQLEQRRQNAEYCKALAAKYTNITELTRQLTEDFVDSIVIGIADENGDREVNISLRV